MYIRGAAGYGSAIPFDFESLEKAALEKMSRRGFDYVKTGAGRESTVRNNRSSFERHLIIPRVMRDVSKLNTQTKIPGAELQTPLLLAPVGVLDLASLNGDVKVARAASNLDIPMIISNQASQSMEEIGRSAGSSTRWMQIYWSKNDDLVRSFINRAEKSGCSALVFTLDTTKLGWRERDLNNAYLPFLEGRGIAQYVSDPVFNKDLDAYQANGTAPPFGKRSLYTLFQLAKNYPGSTLGNLFDKRPIYSVRKFIDIYSNPALNWSHIERARGWTDLPIYIKGILHPEDVLKAIDLGIDGIIVSNHGGRQVDGAISSLEAMIDIRKKIGRDFPLVLDSGIRNGQDIVKALALGADAVSIGRPYVYALAIAGQKGVAAYIQNLHADFELNMALSGSKNIEEVKAIKLKRSNEQ